MTAKTTAPAPPPPGVPLQPDEILTAEFNYIAQTAFQNTEDRARVTSYYAVTIASLVAAILGAQLKDLQILPVYSAFAVLFFILSLNGLLTIFQLVRLRQSWYDSVQAMIQIKTYYTQCHPDLAPAFRWNPASLPPRYKTWSMSFFLAAQVAGLSAAAAATGIGFLGYAFNFSWAVPALIVGVLFFILQLALYRARLQRA